MTQILFLISPGIAGAILRLRHMREVSAWLLSCTVIPLLLLIENLLIPYHGGGAPLWSIALAVGSFFGAISGGLGVVIASFYLKKCRNKTQGS